MSSSLGALRAAHRPCEQTTGTAAKEGGEHRCETEKPALALVLNRLDHFTQPRAVLAKRVRVELSDRTDVEGRHERVQPIELQQSV